MKRSIRWAMAAVMVLVILAGAGFWQTAPKELADNAPSSFRALATRIMLPLIQEQRGTPEVTAIPTSTRTPSPTLTPTPTQTSTPLPTSTPYPTVDLNKEPEGEGPRPDARPDLTVVNVSTNPLYPSADEKVDAAVTIRSNNSAAVPNVLVAVYADGKPLDQTRVDLLPGQQTVVRFPWTAGAAGVHTLTGVVDPNRELTENDLSDNSYTDDVAVSAGAQKAELAVTGLNLDQVTSQAQQADGQPTMLHVQVKNNGSAAADAPLIVYEGPISVTLSTGSLAPGASTTIDVPVSVSPEVGQFSALVNPRYRSLEPNAGDNFKQVDLRPDVDLLIDDLTVEGSLVEAEMPRQVTVSFRVVNIGSQGIAGSFRVKIFPGDVTGPVGPLANNAVSDLTDTILTVNGLGAGASYYAARTVNLPAGVNTFTARVEADIDNAVAESNESNNVATALYSNPTPNVGRWINIGPRRITDSNRHGYPWNDAGGRLSAIAIDPQDTNRMYVGALNSGVWRTLDGGNTWQPIADSLPTLSIAALALDPINHNRLYMVSAHNGVFRSDDGGTSWSQISTTDLNAIVHGGILLVSAENPNRLLVVTSAGIQRSIDGGLHWQLVLSGGTATGLVNDPTTPNRYYAAIYHETDANIAGIYRSDNGGVTWNKLQSCAGAAFPTNTAKAKITLAMTGAKLFAGFKESDSFRFFRTVGGGCSIGAITWPRWEQGWQNTDKPGVFWSGMWSDPTDPNFIYLGGTDFWRSIDGGTTFTPSSSYGTPNGSAHADHHGFTVLPGKATTIFTLNDGGIYRSTNRGAPGSWAFIGDGLRNVEIYDLAVSPTDPNLAIIGTQDNGTIKYDGTSSVWKMIAGGDGATVDIDPTNAKILYGMNQYANSIKRSTDGGATMPGIGGGMPDGAICFNLHFQVDPRTPSTVLASCSYDCSGGACQGGLWRTTNPGVTDFSVLYTPPSGAINRSAVDRTANLYYAGSNDGKLYAGPNGANWRQVFANPSGANGVTDIDIDPDDPNTVYISFARTGVGRIYRLRRTSAAPTSMTFVDITSDLPMDLRVNTLAVDRLSLAPGFTIFAGTPKGVYRGRSTDGGTTWHWTKYDDGMPAVVDVRDLEVNPATGVLRAATFGRSVYEVLTDSPIGSVLAAQGKLTFLRVHDVGTGYGPPSDFLDVEVVIKLDNDSRKSYGFQLRTDANESAHKGMLDLLRDAFNEDYTVRVDYVRTGIHNGKIIRVLTLP